MSIRSNLRSTVNVMGDTLVRNRFSGHDRTETTVLRSLPCDIQPFSSQEYAALGKDTTALMAWMFTEWGGFTKKQRVDVVGGSSVYVGSTFEVDGAVMDVAARGRLFKTPIRQVK